MPLMSDDTDHRWRTVKDFLKIPGFSVYGPREKAIKEILACVPYNGAAEQKN